MSAVNDTSMNTNMHAAFQREIQRLKAGVVKVDLASTEATSKLAARYSFFSETLHHHHEGEDTYLFERVKPKATPAQVAVLDQMEAEHVEMLEVLTSLDADFGSLSTDTDKQSVSNRLDALATVLGQHCAHEETEGMAIVQQHITEADMKEFTKFNRSGAQSNYVLPWVCDGADPGVEASVWDMIPGPVRVVLKPMMTRKYDAFSRECGI